MRGTMKPDPSPALRMGLEFDARFAEPEAVPTLPGFDVLAITLADRAHAIRLGEISGVYAARPLASLPGAPPVLLGLMGIRGALIPIYGLSALLGLDGTRAPRWIVMRRASPFVGFGVDSVQGIRRVPDSSFIPDAASRAPLDGVVRLGDHLRPLVSLVNAESAAHPTPATPRTDS